MWVWNFSDTALVTFQLLDKVKHLEISELAQQPYKTPKSA